MKRIKIVVVTMMLILIAGCTSKDFKNAYNNMQVSDKKINGYSLDLRINGTYNNKNVREIVKITNYKNKEYEIRVVNSGVPTSKDNDEITYIKDNKTYVKGEDEKYTETTAEVKYKDPSVYLEGLKNIAKSSEMKEETIGSKKYKVYEVEFKKGIVEKVVKNSNLEGLKSDKNISGKIYLNEDNQVYRIIYNIGELTINANYYGINTAREINVPTE